MSLPEKSEQQARYASLGNGPWRKKGEHARRELKPPPQIISYLEQTAPIDLRELAKKFEQVDPAGSRRLQQSLRWHGGGNDVEDEVEIALRDSLDYALAHLMLLELAVEADYLPLDLVRKEAHHGLLSLLWSAGAQEFVRSYNYLSIEYLAQRLGVKGFRSLEPPPINPRTSIRFMIFLAQFSEWVEDKPLNFWLSFLDDYVKYDEEQAEFRAFLKGHYHERSRRFDQLLNGIQRFLLSLSNLFGVLKPLERPQFGLFYSYWMAKFFGYELEEDGYKPTAQQSWASIIQAHPDSFLPPTANAEARAAMRELLGQQIATIREAWTVTSELVAASSSSKR